MRVRERMRVRENKSESERENMRGGRRCLQAERMRVRE